MATTTAKAKAPQFTAGQFTDTRFDTADDKAKAANGLTRFIAGGFKESQFTERVYRALMRHFDHIAHYDRRGFYAEWFATPADRVRFLNHLVIDCRDAHYFPGDPWQDVKVALAEHADFLWTVAETQAQIGRDQTEAAERALLAVLKARYETPAA